jgi:hypothetical protein
MCNGTCCADCFAEFEPGAAEPDPGTGVCCSPPAGTICRHRKKGPGDDRCCYPDEQCVKGKCCCDRCLGSVVCGGKCCPIASCCDGTCCRKGHVCVRIRGAAPECVPANRSCQSDDDCHPGETCVGHRTGRGTCCAGDRICEDDLGPICCPAGHYCDRIEPGPICCPVNKICNTYRRHRIRV